MTEAGDTAWIDANDFERRQYLFVLDSFMYMYRFANRFDESMRITCTEWLDLIFDESFSSFGERRYNTK